MTSWLGARAVAATEEEDNGGDHGGFVWSLEL